MRTEKKTPAETQHKSAFSEETTGGCTPSKCGVNREKVRHEIEEALNPL